MTPRSHRRPPPAPAGPLARGLRRLQHLDAEVRMDPALPDRVLAALGLAVDLDAESSATERTLRRARWRAAFSAIALGLPPLLWAAFTSVVLVCVGLLPAKEAARGRAAASSADPCPRREDPGTTDADGRAPDAGSPSAARNRSP